MRFYGLTFASLLIQDLGAMKKTIFIVEDNEDIRDILSVYLSSEIMEVRVFDNAASFLRTFDVDVPDLYLLDINLPDGNGLDLATIIKNKAATKDIPIIVMSAHMRENVMQKIEPGLAFLEKPFDLQHLYSEIVAHCA